MPYAKQQPPHRNSTVGRPSQREDPPEVVDPVWLLKALALSFVAALFCAYATLCLLFYQGEWQLVLHPSHIVDRTPAQAGLAYDDVHFDSAATGQPRLAAWWIPSASQPGLQPRYAVFTILYLHDGSGSLADAVSMLARLHAVGINIFAIDYRGFGASDSSQHPSEARMAQDSAAALDYLTGTRHIPARNIIPYGAGLGASLAVDLARSHSDLPLVILDNPNPDPASTAVAARPSHIVPVRLLFGDKFNIATSLASLNTPKLLIAGGPASNSTVSDDRPLQALFHAAANPRVIVTLPHANSDSEYQTALSRFLDQYLPVH